MSKRMKIIFAVSLILNALLAGFVAGQILGPRHSRPTAEFRNIRADMRENIAIERTKIAEIMKAPEFDQAAFDAQLQKLSDAQCDFNREFMIQFNARVQLMSPEQRREAVDKMISRPNKGKPHGKRK